MTSPLTPEQAAKAFEAFAAAGYPQAKFTDALYRVLCRAFGFIAHYDRGGFYAKRFADLPGRIETLETMAEPEGWCRDRPMEVALRDVVVTRDLLKAARQALATQTEATERAELARLKAKYRAP
jgi:hypothetical protein